jgi:hypothetical protein
VLSALSIAAGVSTIYNLAGQVDLVAGIVGYYTD